jgi:hypothetical protein
VWIGRRRPGQCCAAVCCRREGRGRACCAPEGNTTAEGYSIVVRAHTLALFCFTGACSRPGLSRTPPPGVPRAPTTVSRAAPTLRGRRLLCVLTHAEAALLRAQRLHDGSSAAMNAGGGRRSMSGVRGSVHCGESLPPLVPRRHRLPPSTSASTFHHVAPCSDGWRSSRCGDAVPGDQHSICPVAWPRARHHRMGLPLVLCHSIRDTPHAGTGGHRGTAVLCCFWRPSKPGGGAQGGARARAGALRHAGGAPASHHTARLGLLLLACEHGSLTSVLPPSSCSPRSL